MSLAMYASDYNNENMSNPIQKKREGMRNKTLKRKEPLSKSNPKIEELIKSMHDQEEENDMGDSFQPLGPPSSAGIERMDSQIKNQNSQQEIDNTGAEQNENSQQEAFTQLPSQYAKQYYQQYVPYFNQSSDDLTPNGVNKDELLQKLNQIIYLLEEQQEEKLGNVTEELILYSFLGIFIIFIVDSFARVGKYVR